MFKRVCLFLATSVFALSTYAGPTRLDCQTSTTLDENLKQLETVAAKVDSCPKPTDGKFVNICTLVENQDFKYKKELMAMSCADPKKDSPDTIKSKVRNMWEQYYKEFTCEGDGFPTNGNVLKYSINQHFEFFVDGVVTDFNININIKDPSDNKTLLDFTNDELNKAKAQSAVTQKEKDAKLAKVKELDDLFKHLKNDLKAKLSSEL